MKRFFYGILISGLLFLLLFFLLIQMGDYSISFSSLFHDELAQKIFFQLRLPQVLTPIFVGILLSLSGLLMQTYFANPLADPSILGVSSGASLLLAIWALSVPPSWFFALGTGLVGVLGAFLFLILLLFLSRLIQGKLTILIMGILFSYLANGFISMLMVWGDPYLVKDYLLWTLGSFDRLDLAQALILLILSLMFMGVAFLCSKYLNLILLGEAVAKSLGVSFKKLTFLILILAAFATGLVRAYCGPIAFLALATPFLARVYLKTSDHKKLIPLTALLGIDLALLAQYLCKLLTVSIPINAILGFLGAPIIFFLLWQLKFKEYK